MYIKVEKFVLLLLLLLLIIFELYRKIILDMFVFRGMSFVLFLCVGEDMFGLGVLFGIDVEFVLFVLLIMFICDDGIEYELVFVRFGLARVLVVRGYGDKKLMFIIDDYICVVEFVYDYLM